MAKVGQVLAYLRLHLRLGELLGDLFFHFFKAGLAGLIMVVYFQDQQVLRELDGVGHIAALLLENEILDFLHQQMLAAFIRRQLPTIFGGCRIVGVLARQVAELLPLTGARH